jgi:arsenite-transporting ATPase
VVLELLEHLRSKSVLVVGKGGVGKSTTSAALALSLADRGETVHLLSTDPAHSLGDLFGQPLASGDPTPSACTSRLVVEELDATRYALEWIRSAREPVADLVHRGTYLDVEDVAALLDRSLPGMDELMGALRIADLATSDECDRLVVDAAPTGHLLRMLDAADVLDGWSDALAAMAEKAGAVASAMSGRSARFAGEDVIDQLRRRVEGFRDVMRTGADIVVVTRRGEVVQAETRRLTDALRARGYTVSALVEVGDEGDVGDEVEAGDEGDRRDAGRMVPSFRVPFLEDLTACEGLRRWGLAEARPPAQTTAAAQAPAASAPRPASAAHTPSDGPPALRGLDGRDLYLFVGKGGVGKSTCAAAFALALGRNRDVLLLSTDPAGSLGDVLGVPVGREETRCAPRVVARQIDAGAELAEFRERYHDGIRETFERLGLQGSVLDRRVLESIIGVAPAGIDEIFALDAMLDEAGADRTVVIDAAPTGHLVRLLEMPELARSWTHAVLRILMKYRAALGLDDVATQLLEFARRLDRFIDSSRNPERVAAVVVTLDGALPRLETDRLVATLRRRGTAVAAMIQNRAEGERRDSGADGPYPLSVTAPLMAPPPVGADRLLDFVDRWKCA